MPVSEGTSKGTNKATDQDACQGNFRSSQVYVDIISRNGSAARRSGLTSGLTFAVRSQVGVGICEGRQLTAPEGSWPTAWLPARTVVRVGHWSTSGPQIPNVGLSAWELDCHAFPTTAFAAQRLFALSVSARYRPSQTVPSGTQRARKHSPQVGGDHLIRRLCHAHPLPAHFPADLPKRYSLVRSRRQR
jgi:hypothetical protein